MTGLARPSYATVVARDTHSITVEPEGHHSCASGGFCSAQLFQWWRSQPNTIRLETPGYPHYQVGQRIGIIVTPGEQLRLALWQFGSGLAGLFLGLYVGMAYSGPTTGLLGALVGAAAGLMIAGQLPAARPRLRLRATTRPQPRDTD